MSIPKPKRDWREVATRTAWTAVAAGGAVVVEALTDAPGWWAPIVTSAFTVVLVVARQKAGTLPTG